MSKPKEIIINSRKYGVLKILVDEEDYEKALKYKWSAAHDGCNFYFRVKIYNEEKICVSRKVLHRYLMDITDIKIEVDHINGNTLDNRRCNLRTCLHKDNGKNRKNQKSNTSGYKGVWWCKNNKKWRCCITSDNKRNHIGYFRSKEQAALAYNEAAIKLHGKFARLNII